MILKWLKRPEKGRKDQKYATHFSQIKVASLEITEIKSTCIYVL